MRVKQRRGIRSASFIDAIRLRMLEEIPANAEMSFEQHAMVRSFQNPEIWRKKFLEAWSGLSEQERLAIVATLFIQMLPGGKFLEPSIWTSSLEELWGGLTEKAQSTVVSCALSLGELSELRKKIHGTRQ